MDAPRRVARRQWAVTLAIVAGLVGLVIVGLYVSDPARNLERVAREGEQVRHYRTPGDGVDPSAVWITRSEAELRTLARENQELRRALAELDQAVTRLGERPAPAPTLPALPVPSPAPDAAGEAPVSAPRRLPPPPPAPPRAPSLARSAGAAFPAPRGILVVDLAPGQIADGTDAAPTARRHVRHYLPAGSFARAVLLSGLDAPTGGVANVNPHPVLLTLADHGTLPNRFRSRVEACFVTAAGYGDIASERAYLRLERLSCVLEDGAVIEAALRGFVSGEDGKTGLRGRLVSKQGQIIAKSLLVGIASGIGRGLAQSITTTSTSALGAVQSIDPERIAQYGLAQGAGSALDRIAEWYLERANETYPIIEIDAGRTVDIVLTEGVDLGADLAPEHPRRDRT